MQGVTQFGSNPGTRRDAWPDSLAAAWDVRHLCDEMLHVVQHFVTKDGLFHPTLPEAKPVLHGVTHLL
jgi:hypothetical protein